METTMNVAEAIIIDSCIVSPNTTTTTTNQGYDTTKNNNIILSWWWKKLLLLVSYHDYYYVKSSNNDDSSSSSSFIVLHFLLLILIGIGITPFCQYMYDAFLRNPNNNNKQQQSLSLQRPPFRQTLLYHIVWNISQLCHLNIIIMIIDVSLQQYFVVVQTEDGSCQHHNNSILLLSQLMFRKVLCLLWITNRILLYKRYIIEKILDIIIFGIRYPIQQNLRQQSEQNQQSTLQRSSNHHSGNSSLITSSSNNISNGTHADYNQQHDHHEEKKDEQQNHDDDDDDHQHENHHPIRDSDWNNQNVHDNNMRYRQNKRAKKGYLVIIDRFMNGIIYIGTIWILIDLLHIELGIHESIHNVVMLSSIVTLIFTYLSRDIVTMFVNGLTLSTTNQINIGDDVKFGDGKTIVGVIEHIGWFQTTIRNYDNVIEIIPNSQLGMQRVKNISRTNQCRIQQILRFHYHDALLIPKICDDIINEIKVSCHQPPQYQLIMDGSRPLRAVWTEFCETYLKVVVTVHYNNIIPIGKKFCYIRQQTLLAIYRAVHINHPNVQFVTSLSLLEAPKFFNNNNKNSNNNNGSKKKKSKNSENNLDVGSCR